MGSDRWPQDEAGEILAGESRAGFEPPDLRLQLQRALGNAYRLGREIRGAGSSRVFTKLAQCHCCGRRFDKEWVLTWMTPTGSSYPCVGTHHTKS